MIRPLLAFSFLLLSTCTQKKAADTTHLDNENGVKDSMHQLNSGNASVELAESKADILIDNEYLDSVSSSIDYHYDSIEKITLNARDTSNYISVNTNQDEGGMNALWYFDKESALIGVSYGWAFESQQISYEYFIRNDTVLAVTIIDESGYCTETQRWCIEKGGYRIECGDPGELSADFLNLTMKSLKNY